MKVLILPSILSRTRRNTPPRSLYLMTDDIKWLDVCMSHSTWQGQATYRFRATNASLPTLGAWKEASPVARNKHGEGGRKITPLRLGAARHCRRRRLN